MNIYVGNLHSNASEAQIRDLFKEYGKVLSVKIIMDMETGQSKGFGFVEMDDRVDGLRAVKHLHNQNFMNMYLDVSEANPRPGNRQPRAGGEERKNNGPRNNPRGNNNFSRN